MLGAFFTGVIACLLLAGHCRGQMCPGTPSDAGCQGSDLETYNLRRMNDRDTVTSGSIEQIFCTDDTLPYPGDQTTCLCDGRWSHVACAGFYNFTVNTVRRLRQSSLNGDSDAAMAVDGDTTTCTVTQNEKVNYWLAELVEGAEVVAVHVTERDLIRPFPMPHVFLKNTAGLWAEMKCSTSNKSMFCYARETKFGNTTELAIFHTSRLTICEVDIVLSLASTVNKPASNSPESTVGPFCEADANNVMCNFQKSMWLAPRFNRNYTAGEVARYSCPPELVPYPTDALLCQCDGSWDRDGKYCLAPSYVITSVSVEGGDYPQLAVDQNTTTCVGNKGATYWEGRIEAKKQVAVVRLTVNADHSAGSFCPNILLKNDTENLVKCHPTERYTKEGLTVCLCYAIDVTRGLSNQIIVFSMDSLNICEVEIFLVGDFEAGSVTPPVASATRHASWTVAVFLFALLAFYG